MSPDGLVLYGAGTALWLVLVTGVKLVAPSLVPAALVATIPYLLVLAALTEVITPPRS